ncbi:hypothetical protein [Bacillus toyonensis]|uniref:hypothetical protein n=1 Tax=Bacillus toyonensis TaxID=155322 RepID=UPI0036E8D0BB
MERYIVKIVKPPGTDRGQLTFWVLEETNAEMYGASHQYVHVEEYNILRHYETSAVGGAPSGHISGQETDWEVFYEILGEYCEGTLTNIANEIVNEFSDYTEQFTAFVNYLESELGLHKIEA